MSVITDFTFNNPLIAKYFKGSDEYVPTSEFMYLHTHPLIQPNFVSQIEGLINVTVEHMVAKNMKGGPVNKLLLLAQSLGKVLPVVNESNASEALRILREIYQYCNKITGR